MVSCDRCKGELSNTLMNFTPSHNVQKSCSITRNTEKQSFTSQGLLFLCKKIRMYKRGEADWAEKRKN